MSPGSRLGPYEISAKLGEGGMGEVWRATDPKLGREVAIKVLPELLSSTPELLARFETEARAVAALSHPNILSIFDFGRDGETVYAVTELLDGRTLREELDADGALPIRRTVELGVQIARGLGAAHEKGIVHRDLKPANLFLTRDGRVKILDFGLAKVQDPAFDSRSRIAMEPTVAPATDPGTVLGTVGYMAPEQVRGEPADARSDLFSLGAVLYEMATGERAFVHPTSAETMTAILREEPKALDATDSQLPPTFARVLRHCLEKNPRQRFRSAEDLAFALESGLGVSGSVSAASVASAALAARPAAVRGWRLWLGGVALLAVAAGAFLAGRVSKGAAPVAGDSASPRSFQQLTETPGVESAPTLSPDGRDLVFVSEAAGNRDLYLQRVGDRTARSLTADSKVDDWQPAYSPDGERIAFRSERDGGGIFLMSAGGESVRRLSDFGFSPSWSPDGKEIVVATGFALYATDMAASDVELWAIDVASGKRRLVSKGENAQRPSWSPHGNRIAYWSRRPSSGQRDLFTVAADGSGAEGGAVEVTNDAALDWCPVWSPDGKSLYFSSSRGGTTNLWRIAIDESSGRVTGEPQPVTVPSVYSGEVSFARDGRRFAYSSLDWSSTLYEVGFDPNSGAIVGQKRPLLESNRAIRDHQISPDGQWVAMSLRGSVEDLAVAKLDNSRYLRLTDDPFRDRGPIWSPDGTRIAFYSDRGGRYDVWWIHPDGSGLEQLTAEGPVNNFSVFSPDGSQMAVGTIGRQGWRILDLRSSARPVPSRLVDSKIGAAGDFWPYSWSRDGARLAGAVAYSDGSMRGIALYSLADGRYDLVLSSDSNLNFLWVDWLSDSRRLLVRGEHGISLLDTVTKEMKPLIPVGGYWIGASAGISRDDRRITWTETATEGDVWLAELGEGEARKP